MILEELFSGLVSLALSLAINAPQIHRENPFTLEENPEQEGDYDGLIHHEYEPAQVSELSYCGEDITVSAQHDVKPRRNFCESFLRSCNANVRLILTVVFILGFLILGVVYLDLNTTNACTQWMQKYLEIPANVQGLHIFGMCIFLLPVMSWFPVCIAMLWPFQEFKKNYLCRLCTIVFVTALITWVYKIIMFDKIAQSKNSLWL